MTPGSIFPKLRRFYLLLLITALCWPWNHPSAHPHVFIDYKVTFLTDEQGVNAIRMQWEFDPMFSESIIISYDLNENRKLEPEEVATIKKEAFVNLKNYHYMTKVFLNDQPLRFFVATDFNAKIVKDQLHYYFTLPLEKPVVANDQPQRIRVELFDQDSFIWYTLNEKDNFKKTTSANGFRGTLKVAKRPVYDPFQGDVMLPAMQIELIKE